MKSAFSLTSAGASSAASGCSSGTYASPRSTARVASRMNTYPLPPASTTPARLSTGLRLTVSARASCADSMAQENMSSKSPPCSANSTAELVATRDTVSMVPSAGFMTAL